MEDSTSPFRSALLNAVRPWEIEVEAAQLDLLERHYTAMVSANEAMNLTTITDPVEAAIKHYADSLAILPWARGAGLSTLSLLDVGTGAGFPAVPIAIMRPEWRVKAIDGTRKKAEFVTRVAADLGLKNLDAEHGHSDHWITGAKYAMVTTRAVASLGRCIRTTHRYVQNGGRLIAYKTATLSDEEMNESHQACAEFGMEMEPPLLYELELNAQKMARALFLVRRVS